MKTTPHAEALAAVLTTNSISKDYGPVRVVSDISLDLLPGSIHALLGENGAGKSTLIKILAGIIAPSEGFIEIDGMPRELRSVRDGQARGIVALPQELTLVPTLAAAENIYLGMRRTGWPGISNRRGLDRDARVQLERLGQEISLDVPVGELSAVQQTMIALARAIVRDARVLILDEPTAALTDAETEQLFTVLRALRDEGTAILYVSHRLEEVFSLADTATVLRNGHHVWTKPISETNTNDVVAAMIGREHGQVFPARSTNAGIPLLALNKVQGHRVRGISLEARAGRVLGIAGLAGSGRSELLKIIAGVERAQGGSVLLDGIDITRRSLAATMNAGIVYVPEERRSQGLVMSDTIEANIALANLRSLSVAGVALRSRESATAKRRVAELQIKTTSVRQLVAELSGGNQQKVVLAKYLEREPKILLLDEPTRGIDIGTKAEIYQLIRRLTNNGMAVIVVSSEIPELLGIADEIVVLHEGHLTEIVSADQSSNESILHLCYRKPE
ncbi:sugar ABC transporter ATP-binding protein [Alpinimonas psychrophila]|uniref:Ribose transport system ATP-binding protein/rhamnose transport system ATP-binding protein n=1 Tax=Alpinimonas psychrophila TaxID=748908 RepID=A0A7W3JSF8_9MICO|nr:sugar ABC transporter ATP-binding protein [Alpinimonas psychrophila]MBA8828277.1 ribose transport system ATP-binding protein/rhamnose transport system ATP-binding protein [Alpinimonas psychrophila]